MPHPAVRPPRARRLSRTGLAIALVAAGVIAVVVGVGAGSAASDATPRIDDVQVSDAELALGTVRAERAGADGSDPNAGLDALRDDFALFAVARSVGASDVTRPDDILGVLDDVNDQRASSASAGGVLYGPVTYEAASFYGKSLSDIRQATLARLESGAAGVDVSDAEVRARFDADPGQWADAATSYRLTRVEVPTAADGSPDAAVSEAIRVGDAARVFGTSPGEAVIVTAEQLAAATLSPEATAAIVGAADGALLGPFSERGGWVAYRLDGRSVDTEAAYTHYATRIRAVLVDEHLDALIADARSAQVVATP
ncbi:peptidylprolyl isomerase [Microbacterium sp. VKM Ac-2923]|uniref:peptidylprolyl isomerase n=1 Tax=Microbacterium sp. VKM Ac-2923 TaxID=2929476 RepID=UPI001FB55550|nr:peptidylprolyl isomerase [Microbacterium sp. VKM Ac-2923]MCJ1708829.1 peptidylprolyl isomerase [Microbacterium sp. VKM Ac-2923]